MKHPKTQVAPLQTSPSPHGAPSIRFVQAVVLVPGWQVAQTLSGLGALEAYVLPSMLHCVPHSPPAQTWPLPHALPSSTFSHALVLTLGWQLWHALVGFTPRAA
jgi:hypothetical protein